MWRHFIKSDPSSLVVVGELVSDGLLDMPPSNAIVTSIIEQVSFNWIL